MVAKFVVFIAFLALVQAGVVRRETPAQAGFSLEDVERLNTEFQNRREQHLKEVGAKLREIIENKRKNDSERMQLYKDAYLPPIKLDIAAIQQTIKDFEKQQSLIPENYSRIQFDKNFTS